MSRKKENNIDWGLKFYLEVLKLESLHFGLWNEGDELNIDNMRRAQERYTNELISLIPADARKVLDAGCGTGAQSEILMKKGYRVKALNPDSYQANLFNGRLGSKVPLEQVKFEDFSPASGEIYDLILMSESSQYMNTRRMAASARSVLDNEGYLLVSDYFRKNSGDKYYSTCRVKEDFLEKVIDAGFELEKEVDVTLRVLPTLSLGREIYQEYALPVIQILGGYLSSEYPAAAGIAKRLFSKKLDKVSYYLFQHTRDKTDVDKFYKKIEYLFLLFKKKP